MELLNSGSDPILSLLSRWKLNSKCMGVEKEGVIYGIGFLEAILSKEVLDRCEPSAQIRC
jgi:hypothetical protein